MNLESEIRLSCRATAIKVDELWVSFNRGPVLRGITCSFEAGRPYGLIGPSGSGKSVFLKTVAGILAPDSGTIALNTVANSRVPLALMFQEGALFDSLSVFDNVAFPLVGGKVPIKRSSCPKQEVVCEKVSRILQRVGLDWAGAKMPAELSGGMRRRVSLARSLVVDPQILLLDDPTSGLDPVASSVIMELIANIQRESKTTMIVVSQDLRRLLPMVERVVALFDGQIAAHCGVGDLANCDPLVTRFVACRFDL